MPRSHLCLALLAPQPQTPSVLLVGNAWRGFKAHGPYGMWLGTDPMGKKSPGRSWACRGNRAPGTKDAETHGEVFLVNYPLFYYLLSQPLHPCPSPWHIPNRLQHDPSIFWGGWGCPPAPPGPPGPPRCPRHGEPLRLFCVQDRRAVCVVCHLSREHRTHTVLPAEEAAHAAEPRAVGERDAGRIRRRTSASTTVVEKGTLLVTLGEGFLEVPQEHLSSLRKGREEAKAERERQSEDLLKQTEVERQKIVAECKELRGFLEEKEQLLLSRLEELDRDIVKRRDESVSRLSEEIAQLDKLLGEQGGENGPGNQSGQVVTTAGSSFESWMFCKPEAGFAELEKKLKSFSQKSAVLKEVLLEFKENLRFELENDTGDLSLDPDTANPYLVLSEDKRSVRLRSAPQELPANPKRFDYSFCVLAAEGFVAGRHYWEVEVGDGESWVLGAARESVRRKEKIDFAPEEGIWAVGLNWKGKNWDQYQAFTSPETPLSLCERPRKIGVYLDYEGGWVAFYNADNMAPIFTFTAAFTEKIFPFFWLFYVGSSLSLCN
uniref:B30.2/SPRY domain-containing protein n=1 Tax=Anser cygnoides TaxID=8845 RepID=A0A8B9E6T2_ANSCY